MVLRVSVVEASTESVTSSTPNTHHDFVERRRDVLQVCLPQLRHLEQVHLHHQAACHTTAAATITTTARPSTS